jgi:hypothetical protein
MTQKHISTDAAGPPITAEELLDALEVSNAILEMILKDMRGEKIDVSYPQLTRMFDAQIPANAALIARARAKQALIREEVHTQ